MQGDLFLPAPRLEVERYAAWPFPGLTALETAQAALSHSEEYQAVLVDTVLTGPATATTDQVLAAVPQEWREALGRFAHGHLEERQATPRGIRVKRITDGQGWHFEYTGGMQ